MLGFIIGFIFLSMIVLANWLRFPKEYERLVIFRLGRIVGGARGPGFTFVAWPFEEAVKVSLRTITFDVPPQDIITKDNISAKVNAVAYFRVIDPVKAIVQVHTRHPKWRRPHYAAC